MKKAKEKIIEYIKKLIIFFKKYKKNNPLFFWYIVIYLFETFLLRCLTTQIIFTYKPLFADLAFIIFIGSFSFLIKDEKKRYRYLQTFLIINTILCTIHTIYYSVYASFASITELSSINQATNVKGTVIDILRLYQFVYIIFPFIFSFIYRKIKKRNLNFDTNKSYIKGKIKRTMLTSLVLLIICFITARGYDYSRLYKQWNRSYVVNRFGLILYQSIDVFNYLTSNITSIFGLQNSLNDTIEFYNNDKNYRETNKYTGIFEGYNIIFVHMESIQTFLLDLNFNNNDVLPTTKKLINEGLYFSNFYPEISLGTSSDTEFSLLTSLLPTNTGIVFTNFYNHDYVTIPKLLNDKGYYTFSMHGNDFAMWNRIKAHPALGYKNFYFKDKYTFTEDETLNLGINDLTFFKQSINYLEDIEKNNSNYMGTIITLSNHSPFIFLDKYEKYDLSKTYLVYNKNTNEYENKNIDYLTGTTIGNYIISSHNSDSAMKEFVNDIENSKYFNNTIFVFYGDHDPRLSKEQYNYFYNYDPVLDKTLTEEDKNYYDYNDYKHILNRSTPLIIWSKNKAVRDLINGQIDYPMGMIDIMPTIGNMLNINNKYAIGHDIFNIKENNIIPFPNGDYITNNFLFSSSDDHIYTLKDNVSIKDSYIEYCKKYTSERINISNNIIKYDLLKIINNKNK